MDWASGMPRVGYIPSLNVSYAMAFNSYMGMNTTLGAQENQGANMYSGVLCSLFTTIINHLLPGAYDFLPCEAHHSNSLRRTLQ